MISSKIILLAFIYGLIQDMILNVEQLGIFSFIKSLSIYLILYIKDYESIWSKNN